MSTKAIIATIIGVMIVIVGYFVVTHKQAMDATTSQLVNPLNDITLENRTAPRVVAGNGVTAQKLAIVPHGASAGTLVDLFTQKGDLECTLYGTQGAAIPMTGTLYVSGGKGRADLSQTIKPLGTVTSHIIVLGDAVYTWSNLPSSGIKASFDAAFGNGSKSKYYGPTQNRSVTYDCKASKPDPNLFVVPTSVTFNNLQ